MKKILIALVALTFSLGSFAGNELSYGDDHGDKYCAKMSAGKKVVMHEGKIITANVTLSNGTVVQPDAVVILKDGMRTTLNDGECIGPDGIISGKEKSKPK